MVFNNLSMPSQDTASNGGALQMIAPSSPAAIARRGVSTLVIVHRTELLKQWQARLAMFLDVAEDRATRRKAMTMADWEAELDRFLVFNERPVLRGAGRVSHAAMEQTVHARFDSFDNARRKAADEAAEREHEAELARLVDQAAHAKKGTRL